MIILNATDKFKGRWTRKQNNSKSILDYIMINEEDKEYVKWLMFDEDKTITLFRIAKRKDEIIIYTDHNVIMGKWSWRKEITGKDVRERNKIMTESSYKQFKNRLEGARISEIWEKHGNVKQLYHEWNNKVKTIKTQCDREKTKDIRILTIIKRSLKKKSKFK